MAERAGRRRPTNVACVSSSNGTRMCARGSAIAATAIAAVSRSANPGLFIYMASSQENARTIVHAPAHPFVDRGAAARQPPEHQADYGGRSVWHSAGSRWSPPQGASPCAWWWVSTSARVARPGSIGESSAGHRRPANHFPVSWCLREIVARRHSHPVLGVSPPDALRACAMHASTPALAFSKRDSVPGFIR